MHIKSKNIIVFLLFTIIIILFLLTAIKISPNVYVKQTSINNSVTVVIDAGHGGEDGGTVGADGTKEKDLNLSIAIKIGEYLKSKGISVKYTRTEDILLYDRNINYTNRKKALDLAARVKIAQETENCIFVSIHMNAFPKSQYRGLQVYYSKNNSLSRTLAAEIQSSVKAKLQLFNNRKITKATSNIYLLERITCPAVLIECGFLSNTEECKLLSSEIYQNMLSEIISLEIEKYIQKYY